MSGQTYLYSGAVLEAEQTFLAQVHRIWAEVTGTVGGPSLFDAGRPEILAAAKAQKDRTHPVVGVVWDGERELWVCGCGVLVPCISTSPAASLNERGSDSSRISTTPSASLNERVANSAARGPEWFEAAAGHLDWREWKPRALSARGLGGLVPAEVVIEAVDPLASINPRRADRELPDGFGDAFELNLSELVAASSRLEDYEHCPLVGWRKKPGER